MREIKVQCDCGQRYKFEVEPVDGRVPFTVNCPVCGADGTNRANELLRQESVAAGAPVFSAPMPLPVPAAAEAAGSLKIRLNKAAPDAPAGEPAPATAAPPPSPPPFRGLPKPGAATTNPPPRGKPNFGLGILGAAVGTLVGSLIYFLISHFTGLRLRLLAVGVGYLAGLGAELLGKKEGSKELGMITAVFALAGILAAQYFTAKIWWNAGLGLQSDTSAYEILRIEARKIVTAVPTGSDQEIRIYLAQANVDADEKPKPEAVTADEIKFFRETTLPQMRDLASGKTTKDDFEKQIGIAAAQTDADKAAEERTFKAYFLLLLLNRLNLLALCAGAAMAFKVSSNA